MAESGRSDDRGPLIRRLSCIADASPNTIFLDGECPLTYARAAEDIATWARQLRRDTDGLPVVLRGPNTVEWVLGFLAARMAGRVVIPLSAEVTAEQLRGLGEIVGSFYLFDTALGNGEIVRAAQMPRALPQEAGFCLPTSGSTGLPRLALRSDASLLAEGERYFNGFGWTPADRILAALPLCHAFILGLALGGGLATGCTLYLAPRFTPRTVQRLLQRGGSCSILPLVPASARLLCGAMTSDRPTPQGLRHIVIGAGPLTPELQRDVIERFGRMPDRNYGSTETGATLGSTGQPTPDGVTGAPLPGVAAKIAGDHRGGALFVHLSTPFLGYVSSDGIDTSRTCSDGWYATGDEAMQDEQGWITVTGRLGEGLRRGGRFIQPAEVERALRSHPGVADVAIMGRQDSHGEDVVETHVEARPGMCLDVEDLRQHVTQWIETYKCPTVWHFYDVMPRTSGGKPDRLRLAGQSDTQVGSWRQ